jgi:flavin reductase (DIM6/NTAB) family NADH-FMN oxidoreductase RutF
MEPAAYAALFAQTDRELWLLTAQAGGRRSGLIATFVGQASIVPDMPRVLVGLDHHHFTAELVEASGAFGLHLLGEEHLPWVWRFGIESGRDRDKFEGLTVQRAGTGSPLVAGTIGWMDCRVEARLDVGDRAISVAEVRAAAVERAAPPLTLKHVLQSGAAEPLRRLKEAMIGDGAVAAEAIRAWRRRGGAAPTSG